MASSHSVLTALVGGDSVSEIQIGFMHKFNNSTIIE